MSNPFKVGQVVTVSPQDEGNEEAAKDCTPEKEYTLIAVGQCEFTSEEDVVFEVFTGVPTTEDVYLTDDVGDVVQLHYTSVQAV